MSAVAVSDNDFENQVLKAEGPVMVDFWAEWCRPCQVLLPLVEEVAVEMKDKIKVVKIDIEKSPDTPTKYGVRGIPTLMIFKDGQVVDTRVGSMSKSQITQWIEGAV